MTTKPIFDNSLNSTNTMASDFVSRINALGQVSQQKLVKLLISVPGKKDIVIEPSIMKPLERFIGVSVLRNHGVDKIYRLDNNPLQCVNSSIVYVVRCNLITGKRVCDKINAHLKCRTDCKYYVIFVPKVLVAVEGLFEEEGLFGRVTLLGYSWNLVQLDSRILSFEVPEIFKQLFVATDQSFLPAIAKSLWSLQHVLGKPHTSLFLGKFSNYVSSMMECFDEELGAPDRSHSDVGCLIVMDRDIDYASVLLTPGTYTSLAADVIGVNTGIIEVKKPNATTAEASGTMLLTSEDDIYSQIKNRHFSDVFNYLKKKANELNVEMGKRSNMGIKEMKSFVQNDLGKAATAGKSLANHIYICEQVTNDIGQKFEGLQSSQENILEGLERREVLTHIENIMATATDMYTALRLICLLSLVQNGFTTAESDALRMQFLHAYGHEHISTFHQLEKLGLYHTQPSTITTDTVNLASKVAQVVSFPKKSPFQLAAHKFKLLGDSTKECNLKDPQDLSYVFSGAYTPVVAQFVNYLIKKEMTVGELVRSLPTKVESRLVGVTPESIADLTPRTILVYVVGGITYAEVAALQLLEHRTGCRVICCGTHLVTAKTLLQAVV